jgi:hypothetical protein
MGVNPAECGCFRAIWQHRQHPSSHQRCQHSHVGSAAASESGGTGIYLTSTSSLSIRIRQHHLISVDIISLVHVGGGSLHHRLSRTLPERRGARRCISLRQRQSRPRLLGWHSPIARQQHCPNSCASLTCLSGARPSSIGGTSACFSTATALLTSSGSGCSTAAAAPFRAAAASFRAAMMA